MPDSVRQHAREVAAQSSHVAIDDARLFTLAESLADRPLPLWDTECHYFDGTARSIMYTLILDAVNFCFWPSLFTVTEGGREYGKEDGYFALAMALKQGFHGVTPLWDAEYLRTITEDDFKKVFRTRGDMPLFEQRLSHVRNIGNVLCDRFDGDPIKVLTASGRKAPAFARLLAETFEAYADSRKYRGRRVDFMKRAQICASDIAGSFGSETLGKLDDAHQLTCFADYKLPQLFHNDGIFVYADDLDRKVRAHVTIEEGSEEEVEIRANTIAAVERMALHLESVGRPLAERMIDWLLWNESVVPGRLTVPHHRTLTASY